MKKPLIVLSLAMLPWIGIVAGILQINGLKINKEPSNQENLTAAFYFARKLDDYLVNSIEDLYRQDRNYIDPRLVGFWTKKKYYNSNGFSYVYIQKISLDSDGTLILYEPVSYSSMGQTHIGPSSDLKIETVLKIHTRGNRLYTMYGEPPIEIFVFEFSFSNRYLHIVGADGVRDMLERN
jgi:hypothetical protein